VNWFPIALTTALATASGDALLKAHFSSMTPLHMAVVRAVSPLPFLLPILLLIPWPELTNEFWTTILLLLPLELSALILYMKALKSSPISLSIPFLAFTPVFIILTGWLILGEKITPAGLAGILLTVAGAYILNLNNSMGILGPFMAIFKETGSVLMLTVALLYSITSVLGKKAVLLSNPLFFACFYFIITGLAVLLMAFGANFLLKNSSSTFQALKPRLEWWGVGLCQTLMVLTHMWAISLTQAAYMIAVKRTSLLFSVFYGKFLFGEERISERFAGTSLMVAGVAVIMIKG